MADEITVTHDGVKITYRTEDNRWAFELRNRQRSAESLDKAREVQNHARRFVALGSLKNALHGGFLNARIAYASATMFVHVAGLCTNIRLVCLNVALKLENRIVLHRQANPVQHEPSGFLSDAQGAVKLARANAVLGVHDQPSGRQPFSEAQRRIFEDRSHLGAKLFLAAFAIPDTARLNKLANAFRTASRAFHENAAYQRGKHVWVQDGNTRSKKSVDGCFVVNDSNTALIEQITEFNRQIADLEKQRAAKQSKLQKIEV